MFPKKNNKNSSSSSSTSTRKTTPKKGSILSNLKRRFVDEDPFMGSIESDVELFEGEGDGNLEAACERYVLSGMSSNKDIYSHETIYSSSIQAHDEAIRGHYHSPGR